MVRLTKQDKINIFVAYKKKSDYMNIKYVDGIIFIENKDGEPSRITDRQLQSALKEFSIAESHPKPVPMVQSIPVINEDHPMVQTQTEPEEMDSEAEERQLMILQQRKAQRQAKLKNQRDSSIPQSPLLSETPKIDPIPLKEISIESEAPQNDTPSAPIEHRQIASNLKEMKDMLYESNVGVYNTPINRSINDVSRQQPMNYGYPIAGTQDYSNYGYQSPIAGAKLYPSSFHPQPANPYSQSHPSINSLSFPYEFDENGRPTYRRVTVNI
jgi:hypothetical protein